MIPLEQPQARIEAHWRKVETTFRQVIGPTADDLLVSASRSRDRTTAALDALSEFSERERGGRVPVVQFVTIDDTNAYWLAWHEEWELVTSRRWRYRSMNVTIFQGGIGSPRKLQLFRAEWPGVAAWAPGGLGFQAEGAGHPHWQFDAINSLAKRRGHRAALEALARELDADTGVVEEFGEEAVGLAAASVGLSLPESRWTRTHFPACAAWPDSPWDGRNEATDPHVRTPTDLRQLRNWLSSVLRYLQQELRR